MNLRILFLLVPLLVCADSCLGSGNPGHPAKSAAKVAPQTFDSANAAIRIESVTDGYRVFVQIKGGAQAMSSRCLSWSLGEIKGAKALTSLETNEDACNDQSYPLDKAEAFFRLVGKSANSLAEAYGEDYVAKLASAKNPVLLLEGISYQGGQNRFLELIPGESPAVLVFQATDACWNRADSEDGCEKNALPSPAIGEIRMQLNFILKAGKVEIH